MKKCLISVRRLFFGFLAGLLVISFSSCGKKEEKIVNVYNWGQYIDPQVLKDFEK